MRLSVLVFGAVAIAVAGAPSTHRERTSGLREGLGCEAAIQSIALTSPGVIDKDLIIVGDCVPETFLRPPEDIRTRV